MISYTTFESGFWLLYQNPSIRDIFVIRESFTVGTRAKSKHHIEPNNSTFVS